MTDEELRDIKTRAGSRSSMVVSSPAELDRDALIVEVERLQGTLDCVNEILAHRRVFNGMTEKSAHALQAEAEVERLRAELMTERRFLWLNHGHFGASLYGDDGEMQCNHEHCRRDFLRDPIETLRRSTALRQPDPSALIAAVEEEVRYSCNPWIIGNPEYKTRCSRVVDQARAFVAAYKASREPTA